MRWLKLKLAVGMLAVLGAIAGVVLSLSPASAQDPYARRYYDDEPRYERRVYREPRGYDDYDRERAFQERMRYYSRDAVTRREQQARRSAYGDDVRAPQRRSRGFFQQLFGRSEPDDNDADRWTGRPPVEVRPVPNRIRRKPQPAEAARVAVPVAPAQPAVPPTTFVAVIGDSIADALAGGLAEAFADAPELAIARTVKANAGLVRTDYFDFADAARKAASGQITYAVIDVGVNDRQPFLDMRDAPPLSDRWRQRYVARIDAVLAPFRERKIPVYWVGLAPSESVRASSDHIALNALAKERVEAAGGVYVDVWEGFVDDAGDYAAVGPQLDGQTARLRLDDGVHFSKAGARKLAHYVEQEIRHVFKPKQPAAADALLSALTPGGAPPAEGDALSTPAARTRPVAGPLVVLTAPGSAAANGVLLGGAPSAAQPDANHQILLSGEAPEASPGRLDDHRWPEAGVAGDGAKAPVAAAPQPAP